MLRPSHLLALVLLASSLPASSEAADFHVDGYYRVRGRVYNSLSLTRDDEYSVGTTAYMQQRFRLEPHFGINPYIHLYSQVDLLDLSLFGSSPEVEQKDPWDQLAEGSGGTPNALTQTVLPGEDYESNIAVKRVWAEITTPYVDFRFGRMGNHWGLGVLANDGNCWDCDYGDTVDRVQVRGHVGPASLSLAYQTHAEGLVNANDDVQSFLFTGGYLSESHGLGLYLEYRSKPSEQFGALYADLWGRTRLGPLRLELEAALVYGKWNQGPVPLDPDTGAPLSALSYDELTLLSSGGALKADFSLSPFAAGVEVGYATGDHEISDTEVHTFTFDRDHDIALLLFEEPLPSLLDPTAFDDDGIQVSDTLDSTRMVTGNAVSNALYFTPYAQYDLRENVTARVSGALAWALTDNDRLTGEKTFYGVEADLDVKWRLYENFELGGRAAFLFPGDAFAAETRGFTFGGEARAILRF